MIISCDLIYEKFYYLKFWKDKNMSPNRSKSVFVSAVFFALSGCIAIGFALYRLLFNSVIGSAWSYRLPMFDYLLLIVGIGFLIASIFLFKSKRIGAYVGIISFALAFAVNIYVGANFYVHLVAGIFIGLLLLLPLVFGWKSLT